MNKEKIRKLVKELCDKELYPTKDKQWISDAEIVIQSLLSEDEKQKCWLDDKKVSEIYEPSCPDCQKPHIPNAEEKVGKHPEDYCHICSNENITWYADNDLWNKVMDKREEICCPVCFVKIAESKGIRPTAWRLSVENDTPEIDKMDENKNILDEKPHISSEVWANAKGFIDELDSEIIESVSWSYEKGGTGALESMKITFVSPIYMCKK
jgi:hypothetical protein